MVMRTAIMALLTFFFASTALAQTVTPGQVDDTLTPPPVLQAPESAPELERESTPAAPAESPAGSLKITVTQFEFSGNSAYTQAQLEPLTAAFLNHPLGFSDLYKAADAVTAFYVSQGYTLASVTIPPQKVSDGTVKLEVSEGRIGDIRIEGLQSFKGEHLKPYFSQVLPGQLYRGNTLQNALLLLNDIPGLQTSAVVRPGKEFGTSDLIVRARETRYAGFAALDNYGRESIGELRLSGGLTINNPLQLEDQLQVFGVVSEDALLTYAGLGYSIAINSLGTRAELAYSHAGFDVDSVVPVEGTTDSGRIGLSHPLVLSSTDTWRISGGVSRNESISELAGIVASGTDITLLELGSLYIHRYATAAITQVNTELASNFRRLTRADLNTPNPPVEGKQRLRLQIDAQHLQPLFSGISALIRVNAVYSPDPLVDTQQFSLGGPNSIRAYPAAEIRGDSGTFASITLQRPFFMTGYIFNPRIFAETGRITRKNPNPGVPDADSLAGAGIGFDLNINHYTFKLDWAHATDNHVMAPGSEGQISNGDNGRLFGAVSASF